MSIKELLTERQKQIKKAFGKWLTSDENVNKFGFIAGAEWADANPNKETIVKVLKLKNKVCADVDENGNFFAPLTHDEYADFIIKNWNNKELNK